VIAMLQGAGRGRPTTPGASPQGVNAAI
jgi:hypothetical protein